MIELLLGILCGIALSLFFSFGPAFFSQLQSSIQYGYKKAFPFAFGVNASDIIVVFLLLTVLKNLELFEFLHNTYVAIIGGAVLCGMGIYYLRKKPITANPPDKRNRLKFKLDGNDTRRKTIFFHGFIINLLNPFIWVYWVSVVTLATGELNLTLTERYLFFIGVLGATLSLDLLKCKLASLLQRIITAKVLNISNKATALIMFSFAIYMVVSMLMYQYNPEVRERQQQNSPAEMIKKVHQTGDSSLFQSTTTKAHH